MSEQSNINDDSHPASSYRWIILAVLTATQIGSSIAALSFGPLAPFLQETLNINRAQVGLCTSFLYFGSILVSIPSGRLADLIGVRRILLIGPALMGVFFLTISQITSFRMLWLLTLCAGMGYGVINPSTAKAIVYWFAVKGRATALGIKQSGVTAGAAVAAVALPALAMAYSLRTTLAVVGLVVMILAALCYMLNRDFPSEPDQIRKKSEPDKGVLYIFRNRHLILMSFANLLWAGIQLSVSTYLLLFLKENLLIPVLAAGAYLAVAQVCAGGGRVMWGIVSDRLFGGRRKIVLMIIGIITTVSTLAMSTLTADSPPWLVFIIVAFIGVSVIGRHGVSMTFIAELAGKGSAGTATGAFLTIAYMGIIIGPPIFGHIVDRTGSYSLAWLIFGIQSAVATGILYLVKAPPVTT